MEIIRRIVKLFSPLVAGLLVSTFGILSGVRIGIIVAGTLGITSGLLILLFMRKMRINFLNNKVNKTTRFFGAYLGLFKSVNKKLFSIIFLGSMITFVYAMTSPYLVIYILQKLLSLVELSTALSFQYVMRLSRSLCYPYLDSRLENRRNKLCHCFIIHSFTINASFLVTPKFSRHITWLCSSGNFT